MSAAAAKPIFCEERQRLSESLLAAARDITALQAEQVRNFVNGGDGLPGIDLALAAARKKWYYARGLLFDHIHQHGC